MGMGKIGGEEEWKEGKTGIKLSDLIPLMEAVFLPAAQDHTAYDWPTLSLLLSSRKIMEFKPENQISIQFQVLEVTNGLLNLNSHSSSYQGGFMGYHRGAKRAITRCRG
jgi:hypothetical protein